MTHGGAREGAGRKTGKTHKKVLISLPLAVAEWLEKKDNKSKFISGLVEDKMNKTAREFLTYAGYEITEHNLFRLSAYDQDNNNIRYDQFPDANISHHIANGIEEPANFQEWMEVE